MQTKTCRYLREGDQRFERVGLEFSGMLFLKGYFGGVAPLAESH